jgi:hypothetical protein
VTHSPSGVRVVRGRPSADELAALVAALLARAAGAPEPTPYEAWRAGRIAALRTDPRRPARPKPVAEGA